MQRNHVKGVFARMMIMNRAVSDALIALLPIMVDYVNVSTSIIRLRFDTCPDMQVYFI